MHRALPFNLIGHNDNGAAIGYELRPLRGANDNRDWQCRGLRWVGVHGLGDGQLQQFVKVFQPLRWGDFIEVGHHAHNQFLATLICLGLPGGLLLLLILMYPLWRHRHNWLFCAFSVMIMVSFASDNTLGTQASVTLFSFRPHAHVADGAQSIESAAESSASLSGGRSTPRNR